MGSKPLAFLLIAALTATIVVPSPCEAQTLGLVRQFSTYQGDIQFLPGGIVAVKQNGRESTYLYSKGHFILQSAPLSLNLQNWTSYDWNGVDYLNQIDQKAYDPDINRYLPSEKKVKKILYVPEFEKSKTLVLVCYTQKSTAEYAEPSDVDIFVAGLERRRDKEKLLIYHKLWTIKLGTDINYGDFIYEDVPGMANFVVLYSVSLGGSGYTLILDVYRVVF